MESAVEWSGKKTTAEEASKSSEASRSPTEGTTKSKEGSRKDESRGSTEGKNLSGSAEKKDSEDDEKSDEQRSRSEEEAMFNKLEPFNAEPLKPVTQSAGQKKAASEDELKRPKEKVRESKGRTEERRREEGECRSEGISREVRRKGFLGRSSV
ncbi:hypothetical protein OSTOST_01437 [Ostertagia ostertagi]